MSWVDIAIIGLAALFALFGLLKGVQKTSLVLAAYLISVVLAFFLAKVVAEALLGVASIRQFVLGSEGASLFKWISSGLNPESLAGMSEFAVKNFYEPVIEIISDYTYTEAFDPLTGLALYKSFTLFAAIVGVGIFIIARLLLSIALMIIKSFIPKHKSGLNRLFGFIVGAVRGAVWGMVISFLFTMIGGFTFVSFIDNVEKEYESSVIAKPVYEMTYTVKNKMFLPDKEMYARIVDLSGLTKNEKDKDQPAGSAVKGTRLDIFCNIKNLNYENGGPYANEQDNLITGDDVGKIDVADYSLTGDFAPYSFGGVVAAITRYNDNAGKAIMENALKDASAPDLNLYLVTIQGDASHKDALYYIFWSAADGDQPFFAKIKNYNKLVKECSQETEPANITNKNHEIALLYANLLSDINDIKTQYAKLTLLGALALPELPPLYQNVTVPVKTKLYCDIINLNYDETVCISKDGEPFLVTSAPSHLIDYSKYEESGFDAVVKAIMDYNAAAAQALADMEDPNESALTAYDAIVKTGDNSIYVLLFDSEKGLWVVLDDYEAAIAIAKQTPPEEPEEPEEPENPEEPTEPSEPENPEEPENPVEPEEPEVPEEPETPEEEEEIEPALAPARDADPELEALYQKVVTALDDIKAAYAGLEGAFGPLDIPDYPPVFTLSEEVAE